MAEKEKGVLLAREWLKLLPQMWRWQRNLKVSGASSFKNSPEGATIAIGQAESRRLVTPDKFIWIRPTGHTQVGSNKQWKYDWEEIEKSTAGYGGWAALSGGRTGHSSEYDYAYNTVEEINGASGTYGNGVVSTDLSGSLDIQPVPNNVPLRAFFLFPTTPNSDKSPELWFSYENGVTGGCT